MEISFQAPKGLKSLAGRGHCGNRESVPVTTGTSWLVLHLRLVGDRLLLDGHYFPFILIALKLASDKLSVCKYSVKSQPISSLLCLLDVQFFLSALQCKSVPWLNTL